MRNCCGPFKRGKPAKAINPNQQCFADCCGNLCPPDGCCETVKVEYQCGCGCDCEHRGFNFSGLKFKKKSKKQKIPTFSKKTLAANGFTFAGGTIPGTIPTSSSSTSEPPPGSSSSSCVCEPSSVELSTDGCCLYLGPGGIEAVGSGLVTATYNGSFSSNCPVELALNGQLGNQIEVQDGDVINVQLITPRECDCCETQRDCSAPSTSLWVQKSNKDRATVVLDKEAIRDKVRLAVSRVRKRRGN